MRNRDPGEVLEPHENNLLKLEVQVRAFSVQEKPNKRTRPFTDMPSDGKILRYMIDCTVTMPESLSFQG